MNREQRVAFKRNAAALDLMVLCTICRMYGPSLCEDHS